MAGFLEQLLGTGGDDPRSQAMGLLAAGLMQGNAGQGLLAANQHFAEAPRRKMQDQLAQMQIEQHRMALDKARRDQEQEQQILGAAKGAYRSPDMANALSMGPMPDGGAVPQVAPGFDSKQFLGQMYGINPIKAVEFERSMAKDSPFNKVDAKDFTQPSVAKFAVTKNYADLVPVRKREVGPGGQAYDPYAIEPGTVLADPNKPFSVGAKGAPVPNTPFQEYEVKKARAGASNVSVNTGQKGLDNELKIRSDFRSEPIYKAHQDVISAHSQISQALKQASPAGDLAGATKLMKILDPGSVVRESELGMAMAASGLLDRATNYANMVMSGQKLTPTQRKDFQTLADALYSESIKQYNSKRSEYGKFATDYGLDSERILGPGLTSPKIPSPPATPGGAAQQPGAGVRFLGFE